MSEKKNKPVFSETDEIPAYVDIQDGGPQILASHNPSDQRFYYYGIAEVRSRRYRVMRMLPGQDPEPISIECVTYSEAYNYLKKGDSRGV